MTYITFSQRGSHIADLFFLGGGEVRNLGKHYSISFGPFEATQLIHITPCVLLTSVYSFLQPFYASPYRHALGLPLDFHCKINNNKLQSRGGKNTNV